MTAPTFGLKYGRAEGVRGAQHIAHRLAMTPRGGARAVCGARILSVNLDSLQAAECAVRGVTCAACLDHAWAGHGNEERRAGYSA